MNATDVLQIIGEEDPSLTLRRFSGNETLLLRFMKRFPSDGTYRDLEAAMEKRDYIAAQNAAHTLKGVSGNLGFTKLYTSCTALVDYLRSGGETDTDSFFSVIKEDYHAAISALEQLD